MKNFRGEAVDRVEWNLSIGNLIRGEKVWSAVRKMKKKKAIVPNGVP